MDENQNEAFFLQMTLTLEEIIVKGLDEKLRETNYRSKIYKNSAMPALASHSPVVTPAAVASQSNADAVFATPGLKPGEKTRQRSHDSNSPGDSDYESAQVSRNERVPVYWLAELVSEVEVLGSFPTTSNLSIFWCQPL